MRGGALLILNGGGQRRRHELFSFRSAPRQSARTAARSTSAAAWSGYIGSPAPAAPLFCVGIVGHVEEVERKKGYKLKLKNLGLPQ